MDNALGLRVPRGTIYPVVCVSVCARAECVLCVAQKYVVRCDVCAHFYQGRDTLSYLCDTVRCADRGFTLFFHWKQLWSPRKAKNPSNRLARPRGGGAAPAGDAFAWSGIFGGSPKTTATDEGPEATTCSVRASVATVGTALPLAGPMCSAIFVANELPDVGVRVSCRICGAGRSASGIGPLAVRATVFGCCCNPDARRRSRFAKTCKVSTQRAAKPDLKQACGTQRRPSSAGASRCWSLGGGRSRRLQG